MKHSIVRDVLQELDNKPQQSASNLNYKQRGVSLLKLQSVFQVVLKVPPMKVNCAVHTCNVFIQCNIEPFLFN